MTIRYQDDIVAWANEQARFIRAGRFDLVDIEHIAEEIEDVGKSEKRELESRMAILFCHLLKWQYQTDRRGSSWKKTITVQRREIVKRLNETPSLKGCLNSSDWIESAWADGTQMAANEMNIDFDKLPDYCPWSMDEILNADFLP
jgi:hypothetical protein